MSLSDYKQYLPSTHLMRIVSAVGIAGLLIYGVSLAQTYQSKRDGASEVVIAISEHPEVLALDSDADGLKDWEEALWGTDIHEKDTDGDETPDGEEVRAGRNPLVAGPADALSVTDAYLGAYGKSSVVLSKTEAFAREVFSAIAAQKGTDGYIDAGKVSADSLSYAQSLVGNESARFSSSDIRVVPDTQTTLRAYGNTLGNLLLVFPTTIPQSEMEIVTEALQANNAQTLQGLAPIADAYDDLVKNLSPVPVPKSAQQAHLSLMNAIGGIAGSITNMQQLLSDPLLGMAALGAYREHERDLESALVAIRSVFAAQSMTFSPEDPGRIFNR